MSCLFSPCNRIVLFKALFYRSVVLFQSSQAKISILNSIKHRDQIYLKIMPLPLECLREHLHKKKMFSFGHCPNEGGGRTLPELKNTLYIFIFDGRKRYMYKLPERKHSFFRRCSLIPVTVSVIAFSLTDTQISVPSFFNIPILLLVATNK